MNKQHLDSLQREIERKQKCQARRCLATSCEQPFCIGSSGSVASYSKGKRTGDQDC